MTTKNGLMLQIVAAALDLDAEEMMAQIKTDVSYTLQDTYPGVTAGDMALVGVNLMKELIRAGSDPDMPDEEFRKLFDEDRMVKIGQLGHLYSLIGSALNNMLETELRARILIAKPDALNILQQLVKEASHEVDPAL